ncbi:major facilitator superfamily domain-containing protein [Trametes polyzona]|nr:major facilitator superfamily domain-containing protein [Trametes polyzona]
MASHGQVAPGGNPSESQTEVIVLDIEHAVVEDDPRTWSRARKTVVVATVTAASVLNGLGANIYTPAISQIEEQLGASSGSISLSLSLFIFLQGCTPLVWTTLCEFWGRKRVYLLSTALCFVGCVVCALAKTISVLIAMRCIQATGLSAVLSLGAATLADMYEPRERGAMMGIYYSGPLLGPSLGPILGGVLTQAFSWRATFWFLAIFVGSCFMLFVPFKDTFRRERSLVYQTALRRRPAQQRAAVNASDSVTISSDTRDPTVAGASHNLSQDPPDLKAGEVRGDEVADAPLRHDNVGLEKQERQLQTRPDEATSIVTVASLEQVKLSPSDVNPLKPIVHILRRLNNVTMFLASGLIFACTYSITYTCARTLANQYGFDALRTGLTLLAFGIGSLLGSVLGGRYSDYVYLKVKARHGGTGKAEMRLESTIVPVLFLPPSVIAYGWVCERHVSVAAICVMLFLIGFFSISFYSCTLAYIVDANTGRSSSALAANSTIRGTCALIASEVAVPLQDAIGDGGLYTLWGGLVVIAGLLTLLVRLRGDTWREKWEAKDGGAGQSHPSLC